MSKKNKILYNELFEKIPNKYLLASYIGKKLSYYLNRDYHDSIYKPTNDVYQKVVRDLANSPEISEDVKNRI